MNTHFAFVKPGRVIVFLAAVFLLPACQSVEPERKTVTIGVIGSFSFCGMPSTPGLQLITSKKAYRQWYDSRKAMTDQIPEPAGESLFRTRDVLVIRMGQQASSGYGLGLSTPHAIVDRGEMKIQVQWVMPRPGTMQVQVVTHPCLLLLIPRNRKYQLITVLDQENKKRFTLNVARTVK